MNFTYLIILMLVAVILFQQSCSSNKETSEHKLHNQIGLLVWSGSPELDGMGMLFKVSDISYGVPGNRDDYKNYFSEGVNEAWIRADIKLTGKTVVRGWGAEFPEIEFLRIRSI